MIREVGGLGLGGPRGKGSPKCLKGPKTTYTTILIAEKQSKKSKKGPFFIYWVPPGPTKEMELMGPGGEGPSRSPPPGFSSHAFNHKEVGTYVKKYSLTNHTVCRPLLFFSVGEYQD